MKRPAFFLGIFALASCGQKIGPLPNAAPFAQALRPASCYVTTVKPKTAKATITFYGWPDNTPPGNAIAHPVIHQAAGGDGTYCNPTTFATERKNNATIPYGTKIYVPFIKKYFVREDLCAASGPPNGSGSNGCYRLWFDLWIGGNGKSNTNAVVNCETHLTPNAMVDVVIDPDGSYPVASPGPIYRNKPQPAGRCNGQPGNTHPLWAQPAKARHATVTPQLVGYWAGWEKHDLAQEPPGVTTVIVSFGFVKGHSVVDGAIKRGYVTAAAIAKLHARGIKVLLGLGGSSPAHAFNFDGDVNGFVASLRAFVTKTPYDGVDFDDESGTQLERNQTLITLIPATRQYFDKIGRSSFIVTYPSFDTPDTIDDKKVLHRVGRYLSWVNVMCYTANDVKLAEKDLAEFGAIYDKSKLMMGTDLDNYKVTDTPLHEMADYVRNNGYGGFMVWTINNIAPGQVKAIDTGLGI